MANLPAKCDDNGERDAANLPAKCDERQAAEEAVTKLLKRAEGGDASALPALQKYLEVPRCVDMLGGDLARQIELHLIERAAGKNLAFKEALTRKTEIMRAALMGPQPTAVERLLAERIVTCWLHLHDTEIRYVHSTDLTINQADYRHRAIDRCQKRFLAAIKTLATIRRLALPVLQVNIAEKQVNQAG